MFRSIYVVPLMAVAAPVAAQSTLADVQAHLRAVSSMTAHFSQTDRNGRVLSGTLAIKRPGHLRFDYPKDAGILLVADGRTLNFIDYKVNQVSRWPIGKSPLGILLDPARDISGIAHVVASPNSRLTLVDARDPKHPEFGTIRLSFQHVASAPGGLQLLGWLAADSQGNTTEIRLSDQRFNTPLSDEMFNWRDPRQNGHAH